MNQERSEAEQRQFRRMTETPVPRLVSALAVPTILSMLSTTVYNMVDTFFVAKLDTNTAAGVGIVVGIQAVGFMIGDGCGG